MIPITFLVNGSPKRFKCSLVSNWMDLSNAMENSPGNTVVHKVALDKDLTLVSIFNSIGDIPFFRQKLEGSILKLTKPNEVVSEVNKTPMVFRGFLENEHGDFCLFSLPERPKECILYAYLEGPPFHRVDESSAYPKILA